MIKRLALDTDARAHAWEWPEYDQRKVPYLLSPRLPFRKIVVMIDNEILESPPASQCPTQSQLLTDLLERELVRLYRYADEGPPSTLTPKPEHPSLYDGWVVVVDSGSNSGACGVVYGNEGLYSLAGVVGNAVDVAEGDQSTNAYATLEPAVASKRRRADTLAAQVASQALGADLYVTERPYLHEASWGVARGVTLCRPSEALPLLGLYFRAQGEFPVASRVTLNRGLFYWVGTRELLPEGWRWFTACVQSSSGTSDDSIMLLGGSLLQRVQRALEARDRVHLALNQPQHNDTQEEALSQLDVSLFNLMGAVDVAARVAHRVLNLPSQNEYRAAWQNRRPGAWLDQVRALNPNLAAVVDAASYGDHVITILRLLRNSVHGEALQGLAVAKGGSLIDNLVGLPAGDEVDLLAAMDALGGRASWGVQATLPTGGVHVDPGVLIDRLLETTLVVLNELMAKTPVEQLAHVSLTLADAQPPPAAPAGQPPDAFHPCIRESIRWQLGL